MKPPKLPQVVPCPFCGTDNEVEQLIVECWYCGDAFRADWQSRNPDEQERAS